MKPGSNRGRVKPLERNKGPRASIRTLTTCEGMLPEEAYVLLTYPQTLDCYVAASLYAFL